MNRNYVDMPDRQTDLLIRFLNQNNGHLPKRARNRESKKLTESEVNAIERKFRDIFS